MNDKLSSELLRGSLDLMVLSALADGPKYGYMIQQQLRQASRSMVDVQAGTLYPLLHRLESEKLVRPKWDSTTGRRRKWYELTAAGRTRLERQANQWHEYVACLSALLGPLKRGRASPA